jgi:hypothetical protein
MFAGLIQVIAVALFFACLYHSWQTEGRNYAQQWFAAGYYFAVLREVLLVQLGAISYSDQMANFGGAPSLTSLLLPALFYIAYAVAQRLNPADEYRPMLLTMFLLTPALALPLDATALQFDWWSYPSGSLAFLDGVPYFVPIAWSITGALFYAFIRFVRRIRLRGSGQLFALILGAPLVAGVDVALIALLQVVVNLLALVPGNLLLNLAMALLFVLAPLGLLARRPRKEFGR